MFWVLERDTGNLSLKATQNIDKTKTLMTNGSLMKAESIAECSPQSILQCFGPALSNYPSKKTIKSSF